MSGRKPSACTTEDNMRALLIGVATLALSSAIASAQVVYPGYGYAPYGYGYAASAPLYDYAARGYGYAAPAYAAPATAGTTVIIATHRAIGAATGAGVPDIGVAEDTYIEFAGVLRVRWSR